MSSKAPELDAGIGRAGGSSRFSFFFLAHLTLLAIVLLGFSPSFYLRPAFHHTVQLPSLLIVHGTVLTLWFSLAVLQAWLIRSRRFALHRQMGYFCAGFASLVILFGVLANLRLIGEIDSPADGENVVIWGNFFTLAMFAVLVCLAVVYRGRPDMHKRLTLLASISIIGPALARLPRWPIFAGGLESGRIYGIGGLLLMFAALVTYDILVRRRPHAASVGGMVAITIGIAGAVYLGVTGTGYAWLHGP